MVFNNRHPADELADTRAQLRGLKEREAELRAELLDRRGDELVGETFAAQVAVIDFCRPWMGSARGAQDADNIWCPVLYEGHRGWANAYFLADDRGERVACVMYPTARGCASTAGR